MEPWIDNKDLDTVILGCTHFPLVKTELQELLPQVKFFVDSGSAIAKRVKNLLSEQIIYSESDKKPQENLAFCTAKTGNFLAREKVMQKWGFASLMELNCK